MAKITLALKTLAQVAVAAAGTAQRLSATTLPVRQAIIQWDPNNTGDVYIGESDVVPGKCIVLNAANPGMALNAEDTVADEDNVFFDLTDIWIDAANTNDKVNIAYIDVTDKSYNS